MSVTPAVRQNHILNALSPEVIARLSPHLELIPLALGEVVYESGAAMTHVFFPTDAIVSLLVSGGLNPQRIGDDTRI